MVKKQLDVSTNNYISTSNFIFASNSNAFSLTDLASLDHVFRVNIFCTVSKIVMYSLLYTLTHTLLIVLHVSIGGN